jgi:hypothetical protein
MGLVDGTSILSIPPALPRRFSHPHAQNPVTFPAIKVSVGNIRALTRGRCGRGFMLGP